MMHKMEDEMSKRNLYLNIRSEHIIGKVKNKGYSSISDYVNEGILNNYIPCFIDVFRVEALRLMDLLTDNDINITGKTLYITNKARINHVIDDALGRSVLWLKDHHISNNEALIELLNFYVDERDDSFLKEFNSWYTKPLYEFVKNKIEFIINDKVPDSLVYIAKLILDNWGEFLDESRSYEFISFVIYNAKRSSDFLPENVFGFLQKLEATVIFELINK